jgi:hypothetical protein
LVYLKNIMVQNTPSSQGIPVFNKLGILESLVYLSPESFFFVNLLILVPSTPTSQLPGLFITGESRFPELFTTRESRLPSVFTTVSRDPRVYSSLSRHFGYQGAVLLILKSIQQP